MSGSGIDPGDVARLLRQQAEMGQGPLYLQGMSREEALARLRPEPSVRPAQGVRVGGRPGGAPDPASAPRAPAVSRAAAGPGGGKGALAGAALPVLPAELEALRAEALACTRCGLHEGRTQAVFSDGALDARLMVVGEAPGANEDRTGLPFVGAAGKLLDLMLGSVGFSRKESVYICNVIKCRPPGNRNPTPPEIEACSPFLRRQIQLVRPEAILAVGSFSAQLLTGTELALGKLRGEVYSYEGVPLVITYHPAALLRNSGWSRAAWDDLQLLRQVMEGR